MQIPGAPYDDLLIEHLEVARAVLPSDTPWVDVHTHTGQSDPDGVTATSAELLAGLDRAGVHKAVVFTAAEPDGYPPANDRVLAEVEASGGRLRAFARIDPNAGDPGPEAHRCLAAGARGFKLHPRSDSFVMSHPSVESLVQIAAEARVPVLVHAGRGIPALGADLVDLARRYPTASFILAHAGISDLGLVAPAANELSNLFFDTSWWLVSDLLALYESVDPSRILFASDMPYGSGRYAALAFLRCAREVGHGPEVLAAIAAGNTERVLAGEAPIDLGGAPGRGVLGARWLAGERVIAYAGVALQLRFRGMDSTEALALARLACQVPTGGFNGAAEEAELLRVIDGLLEQAQALPAPPPPGELSPTRAGEAAPVLAAQLLAGTPRVDLG